MRRWACLGLLSLALLPGCIPADAADSAEVARALRMLSKSMAELDDARSTRKRAAGGRPSEAAEAALAGAVAELRLVVHQAERTTARLAERVPPAAPGQIDVLRASTERLREAVAAGRPGELRGRAEELEVHAQQISAMLRGVVDGVRPGLRRPAPGAGFLSGRVPSAAGVLAVRAGAALYTAATLAGLVAALAARDKLARRRRRLNGLVFAGLAALGLLATTAGAPAIATLMAPELSIPDGEQVCATAISRGAELDRALRIAVERLPGREGARSPSRRELLVLARGGSERGLLAQAAPEIATGPGAAPEVGADRLAREVRELAAECVAFAVAGEAAEEARYHHALAAEYLGRPLPCAEPGPCGGG